jgi:hypothetical protein
VHFCVSVSVSIRIHTVSFIRIRIRFKGLDMDKDPKGSISTLKMLNGIQIYNKMSYYVRKMLQTHTVLFDFSFLRMGLGLEDWKGLTEIYRNIL